MHIKCEKLTAFLLTTESLNFASDEAALRPRESLKRNQCCADRQTERQRCNSVHSAYGALIKNTTQTQN